MPTVFGQIVIGPPGSGKTTYCEGMSQFLKSLGRNVAIVNLDPANENVPYKADIDVADLIQVIFSMNEIQVSLATRRGSVPEKF
jgi:GTPase SAR1 family protein